MKNYLLISMFSLFLFQINANTIDITLNEKVKQNLTCFNYYDEVDFNGEIQELYLKYNDTMAYLLPMYNSNDFLFTLEDENGEIRPVAILDDSTEEMIKFKNKNNKKTFLTVYLGKNEGVFFVDDISFIKDNISETSRNCVSDCFQDFVESCADEPLCTIDCLLAPQLCTVITIGICTWECL